MANKSEDRKIQSKHQSSLDRIFTKRCVASSFATKQTDILLLLLSYSMGLYIEKDPARQLAG
eukprot:342776-Prorocentrum_minimum.AAC.1